jgi:hypothetical protein
MRLFVPVSYGECLSRELYPGLKLRRGRMTIVLLSRGKGTWFVEVHPHDAAIGPTTLTVSEKFLYERFVLTVESKLWRVLE